MNPCFICQIERLGLFQHLKVYPEQIFKCQRNFRLCIWISCSSMIASIRLTFLATNYLAKNSLRACTRNCCVFQFGLKTCTILMLILKCFTLSVKQRKFNCTTLSSSIETSHRMWEKNYTSVSFFTTLFMGTFYLVSSPVTNLPKRPILILC